MHKHYLGVKCCKTIFQANDSSKQAGVGILISDKIDFQPKVIKKDMEGQTAPFIVGHVYGAGRTWLLPGNYGV